MTLPDAKHVDWIRLHHLLNEYDGVLEISVGFVVLKLNSVKSGGKVLGFSAISTASFPEAINQCMTTAEEWLMRYYKK